jgi:hypothetical protein
MSTPDLTEQETRDFWKSVYLSAVTTETTDAAARTADHAVAAMLARIPSAGGQAPLRRGGKEY